MSGRGNASGPRTSSLSYQAACKIFAGTKKQSQRYRNECVMNFIKCTFVNLFFMQNVKGSQVNN